MKEIYNGETVALGGVNLVTKQVIVDDSTGEQANFTYDKTTGSITVLDEVDPDSVNPVTARAVAQAVAGASGEVPIIGDDDNGKVLKAVVSGGQKSAEWGEAAPAVTVDQVYNASSTNAQSGVAVSEGIYLNRPLTTTQASGTEIDLDVKGDAPIKLVAEDYGSEAGPSVAATFKVAKVRPVGPTSGPLGVEVIFDLPASQHLPISVQVTINEDISGSNPNMYYLYGDSYFGPAENDSITDSYSLLTSFATTDADHHTFLAGTYNVTITNGNPFFEFSQVGITFNGNGAPGAWEEIRDYIIANASTLFSLSLPSTVKTARLLPAATSSDENKVLTVNSTGKPVWAAAQSGPSYASGDGIEISNNKIAVRAGKNLDFANALVANHFYSPVRNYPQGSSSYYWSFIGQLNAARVIQLRQGMPIEMKAAASLKMTGATGGAHFAICRKNSDNTPKLDGNVVLIANAALSTDTSRNFLLYYGDTFVADFSSLSPKSVGSFSDIFDVEDQYYLTVISYADDGSVADAKYINGTHYDPSDINTSYYYTEDPSVKELVAVDQIPSFTSADSGKVLTVNASTGKPVWAAVPGGSAITYLNGTESAKDIMDMLDAGAFPVYKETITTAADDISYLYYVVTKTHAYVDDQSMPAYSLTLTCLYPHWSPDQTSATGYVARIAGYRIIGSTWTKTDVQVV